MKTILFTASALAALAIAGSASAEGTFSYNVSATSDYVFRGISQTDAGPAIQGGIDYSNGIFYAGAWASNVDFADYEADLYIGVKPTYKDFSFDFGVITYQYGDEALNSTEAKAAVSHGFYKGTIGAAYYYNFDFDDTAYYEINASYPLTEKLAVSGALGLQESGGLDYSTANVGLTYTVNSTFSIDARYSDTTGSTAGKLGDPRLAVSLKAAF